MYQKRFGVSPAAVPSEQMSDQTTQEVDNEVENEVENETDKLSILMVSDFFLPGLGGVEFHMYNVAAELACLGHKVVIVTHWRRPRRYGVRHFKGNVKVYYLPLAEIYDVVTLPTCISVLPLIRQIILREQIQIVHGHQATSNLALECMFHARTMGLHVIFTDHSLFGFEARGEIHINKLLKIYLSDVDYAICVSHTDRENLVLRASLMPENVFVIPNALRARSFFPDVRKRPAPPALNVVVISRLAYRKGIDLLVDVIPEVCSCNPNVRFIIGGDGPKRLALEEMREKWQLEDRVRLLGALPHEQVAEVLQCGSIFLNASLTEAFCTAIVEAAAAGLLVVSTNVGGVPEVLPPHMRKLTDPNPAALVRGVLEAVEEVAHVDPDEFHRQVARMYSWRDVARRTVTVYQRSMRKPPMTMLQRLSRIHRAGPISGKIFGFICVLDYVLLWILSYLYPKRGIDIVPDDPPNKLSNVKHREKSLA